MTSAKIKSINPTEVNKNHLMKGGFSNKHATHAYTGAPLKPCLEIWFGLCWLPLLSPVFSPIFETVRAFSAELPARPGQSKFPARMSLNLL